MNKTNNKQNYNIYIYSVIIFLTIILITYLIYTFNYDSNSLNNSKNIKEENTLINIYNDSSNITKTLLSSYSTNLYDKDENRIYNIKKACNLLNGYILKSNEEFSFNKTIGKIDESTGYKKAIGFDSTGNNIQIYGGGICQISSTLYNAVLKANLKVTERHAHSRRVSYVPYNKDATVCSNGVDFKFFNNSNNDIIIFAKTDGFNVNIELMAIKSNHVSK